MIETCDNLNVCLGQQRCRFISERCSTWQAPCEWDEIPTHRVDYPSVTFDSAPLFRQEYPTTPTEAWASTDAAE